MSGKTIPSSSEAPKTPESAYGAPPEPVSAAEAAATEDLARNGRSSLSPPDDKVPPSIQAAAFAKASALKPADDSKVPPSIAPPRAPEPVAVAPPRAPAQAPGKFSTYENEWSVPASSGLSSSSLPGEESAIEAAQGGQPAPQGGGSMKQMSRKVGSERAMDDTPTTHKNWVSFIQLYFCVLFIIVMLLALYLAIAIKQGYEVTTLGPTDLPSYDTARPLPNVTDDVYQHTAGKDLSLKSEVEMLTVAVFAEGGKASARFEGDEGGNHDSPTQLHERYQEANAAACEKNVTDFDDDDTESKSFVTLLPGLRPESRSTAADAHSNAEIIRDVDFNASLS